MAEYQILVPPQSGRRRNVVDLVSCGGPRRGGGGGYAIGRHNAGSGKQANGFGWRNDCVPSEADFPSVSTVPATARRTCPSDQVVTVHFSVAGLDPTAMPTSIHR